MKKYAVDGLDGYPNELAHMLDDALELNAELLAALKGLVDDYEWPGSFDYKNAIEVIAKAEGGE